MIRTKAFKDYVMTSHLTRPPRVAVCGIGFVGSTLVRLVAEKGWQLVAAFNRKGEKVGQDVGRVAGLGRDLGVIVQDSDCVPDTDFSADIVLIAAGNTLADNVMVYENFLTKGVNVLCHGSESYCPRWFDKGLAKHIDQLAKQNRVTFSGGGIWDVSRLWSGFLAAGPCLEIQSITHTSATEVARQGVHALAWFGAGLSLEQWHREIGSDVGTMNFYHIPAVVLLEKLGYTISKVKAYMEPITWDVNIYSPDLQTELEAGACVGSRICIDIETLEGVPARCEIENRVFREGDIEEMCWYIHGAPDSEIRVIRHDSGLASAASFFNRIPDVLRAKPGIVELLEMGPLKTSATR